MGAEDADRGQRGRARGPQPNTGIQPRWTPRPAEHQRTTDSRPQSRTQEGSIRGETQKPGDQVAPRTRGWPEAAPPGKEEKPMRFDLTRPCENCPFRTDATRITFAARERAEEIDEQAYRNGFPCHVSAKLTENPLSGEEGFVFGKQTQHCAGYLLMQLHEGG